MKIERANVDAVARPLRPSGALFAAALLATVSSALAGAASAAVPAVDGLAAQPAAVKPGQALTLTVEAQDADCVGVCTSGCGTYLRDDLTAWTTPGGTFGSFVKVVPGTVGSPATGSRSPYVGQAVWTAPAAEGTYTISVSVSDSATSMCGGRKSATATVTVRVAEVLNAPPVVSAVSASPAQLFPGQESRLECKAGDPDGDPLTFTWSTDVGAISGSADSSATFTAAGTGTATITCNASDGQGGSAQGTAQVVVSEALAEKQIATGLHAPRRVAVDSMGDVFVVDGAYGITVVNFATHEIVYRLRVADATSLAIDWADRMLVGGQSGARLLTRTGDLVLALAPAEPLGPVTDVAVDAANGRYAALHGEARRVVVYDRGGAVLHDLGTPGTDVAALKRPVGLAFTPTGQVVVADAAQGQVQVFDLGGARVATHGTAGAGAGKFVQLAGVAVGPDGVVYGTDAYQTFAQSFNPDGSLREVFGGWEAGPGQLRTPAGVTMAPGLGRLIVASLNSGSLQVFRTTAAPTTNRQPEPLLSTAALAFSAQLQGTVSPVQALLLSNAGDAPLGVRTVSVAGEFIAGHDCGPFLDPGASCRLEVSFAPLAAGATAGELVIETSAADGRRTVALQGVGAAGAGLSLSAGRLVFGPQVVGTTSTPHDVRLTNSGGAALSIAGIRIGGEGFGYSSDCGDLVPAGGSCRLSVNFAPTAPGTSAGSLDLDTNALVGQSRIALEGTGLARSLAFDPAALDFGQQRPREASVPRQLKLSNVGTAVVTVRSAGLEGSDPAAFEFFADGCSAAILAPGGSCLVELSFTPVAEREYAARARFDTDAPDGLVTADLLGFGDAVGGELLFRDDFESGDLSAWSLSSSPAVTWLKLDPTRAARAVMPVDFGGPGAAEASRVILIVNEGSAAVTPAPYELVGTGAPEWNVTEDTCTFARVEAGASCRLVVTFAPTGPWHSAQARLVVGFQGAPASAVFELRGHSWPVRRQP